MSEPIIQKCYDVLAAIRSLVSPGLGQLYVGKWKLAIGLPFVFAVTFGLIGWTRLIFLSEGMFVVLGISVFFYLYLMTSDRKSTRLNSSHQIISYAVFCLKKKKRLCSKIMTHNINMNHAK